MIANPLWQGPHTAATAHTTCATCAWQQPGGRGRPVPRCARHDGQRVALDWPACPAHTVALDCADCGACCREAFHVVELGARDPFRRARPELLRQQDGRWELPRRPDGRCPCLEGEPGTWRCDSYDQRPRTCRDFTLGSTNCVEARRRVGLTP